MEKKTAHAAEQDRPDVLRQRWAWFDGQPDLDPDRRVFIDETWASTKMARTHGRAPRGERLRSPIPHGHWKTTTFVAGLRNSGMIAPMVLDGPINGVAFQAYSASARQSRRRARASSTSRPTAPSSTQSRTPSPS